jgi:hypothetical protein
MAREKEAESCSGEGGRSARGRGEIASEDRPVEKAEEKGSLKTGTPPLDNPPAPLPPPI